MIPLSETPPKHPGSAKWYWLKWSDTELQGATISSGNWSTTDNVSIDDQSFSGQTAGVKVSGGVDGEYVTLWVQIQTTGPETLHESLVIKIDAKHGH